MSLTPLEENLLVKIANKEYRVEPGNLKVEYVPGLVFNKALFKEKETGRKFIVIGKYRIYIEEE